MPRLDLQADNDPFHPLRKMNELGDRVSIAVIANASHALLPEQPHAVVDAIVARVRGL
jgi:pimeloyl-ACP methyl ester carboxylesterase